ncbi:MAG: hypothetical protein GF398_13505 [Chitinivibrionales bacterium]|nr:hypothetical protein [Chitinivibrionales bacterium]
MDKMKEIEHKVLNGLVLDEKGRWVPIARKVAMEREFFSHLERGQVLINRKWLSVDQALSLGNEQGQNEQGQNEQPQPVAAAASRDTAAHESDTGVCETDSPPGPQKPIRQEQISDDNADAAEPEFADETTMFGSEFEKTMPLTISTVRRIMQESSEATEEPAAAVTPELDAKDAAGAVQAITAPAEDPAPEEAAVRDADTKRMPPPRDPPPAPELNDAAGETDTREAPAPGEGEAGASWESARKSSAKVFAILSAVIAALAAALFAIFQLVL